MVVAGRLVLAFKFVVEEALLKDRHLQPEFITGFEGIFGALGCHSHTRVMRASFWE